MPIPTPDTGESRNDFMSRCVEFLINEGTDQEQAVAICSIQWEENKSAMDTLNMPDFKNKEDKIDFLVENKKKIIKLKKESLKRADGLNHSGIRYLHSEKELKAIKSNIKIDNPSNELGVLVAINSTNWMDSHDDVHFPGLWTKSIQENKMIMHLQEHIMGFKTTISEGEDLKVYTKNYSWIELGLNIPGTTQLLIFDSIVKRERNEFMWKQYANGWVKNHSVGMRYVKIFLAVNNPRYDEEFDIWEKYYNQIANKERADELGYFYAVTEAKVIEGSAVPLGSNIMTPTINNNKLEPGLLTQEKEPHESTQKGINYKYLAENFNI